MSDDKKISELSTLSPVDDNDYLVVVDRSDTTMSVDGTTKKALKTELKGDKGDTGTAATVDAGTTTTLAAGESATVTNVGTTSAAIFDFGIPKGDKGDKGDTGDTGPAGSDGLMTSVVAGTGISVDSTDPANPVVSSTITQATRDSLGLDTDDTVTFAAVKLTTGAGLGKVLTSDADGDATWETPAATVTKATGAELDTGTNDDKFATAKAIKDSHNVPSVAPGTSGNVLTSNGTDWTSAAPAAGSSVWTAVPGTPTRTGNTTFTITGDYTALVTTGMVIKWTESAAVKVGLVLSSTYSSPNTTVTIVGDTMASVDASSCKYFNKAADVIHFAYAGTIGAITGNFTINLLTKRTGTGSVGTNFFNDAIIDIGSITDNTGFGIYCAAEDAATPGQISWRINQTYNNYAAINYTLPLNTYVMVSVVYNGNTVTTYINGSQISQINHSTNPSSATTWSLGWRENNQEYYQGCIDEVVVENRAWTASEIKKYYTNSLGRF